MNTCLVILCADIPIDIAQKIVMHEGKDKHKTDKPPVGGYSIITERHVIGRSFALVTRQCPCGLNPPCSLGYPPVSGVR